MTSQPLLSPRDRAVVTHVARFGQLSAEHIYQLLFSELSSKTPAYRSVNRLTAAHFLHRIERRIVGGAHGGSGQYVFSLGRRGFYMFNEGRYDPQRTVRAHPLAVADCYVVIRQLERAGLLSVTAVSNEPDSWTAIGGVRLKPDLYAEVLKRSGETFKVWIEMDLGTEAQRQLRTKLESYWEAYENYTAPVFPLVVWVAIDDERARELKWLINQRPQSRQLFHVCTRVTLANLFM